MWIRLHVKYPLFWSDFNKKWIFWTDFRKKKNKNIKFHQNPSSGSRVVCWRTDRQTYTTKLIVAFRNFANAPNKGVDWNYLAPQREKINTIMQLQTPKLKAISRPVEQQFNIVGYIFCASVIHTLVSSLLHDNIFQCCYMFRLQNVVILSERVITCQLKMVKYLHMLVSFSN
jgi:hypothetical protein